MSKKSRERYKDRFKTGAEPETKPTASLEALKRRRNKRFLIVGLIGISFPILELIAYQFRAITVSFSNRTDQVIRSIKVSYDGGAFDLPEIKPGGGATRVIRPDFRFNSNEFSTYQMTISIAPEDGGILRLRSRVGALDYSAKEIYTIQKVPPNGQVEIQHSTRPGFPLGLARDLMERLGFG